MCKMSQLYTELTEQANELGFEDINEAEQHGYSVDYVEHKLVKVDKEKEAIELEIAMLEHDIKRNEMRIIELKNKLKERK